MSCSNKDEYCYIVYKVTSPSNKIYIGLSKRSLKQRRWWHYYEANKKQTKYKFHRAIRKYKEELVWEVLKTGLSKELACKYEMYFIKTLNTYCNGYNSTLGGQTGLGIVFDEDRLANMSRMSKDQFKNNPWMKENMSKFQKERLKDPKNLEDHCKMLKRVHGTKEARLRNAQKRGGKPFNVYNFITKEYVKTYEIIQDANLELGLPNGKVSWCLSGKRNHCKTYIFKYIDDPSVNELQYNKEWDKKIKRKPNGIK